MQHIEIARQNQQAQLNGWKRDQDLNQIATDRIELDFSMLGAIPQTSSRTSS